jgi:hypothetical protein
LASRRRKSTISRFALAAIAIALAAACPRAGFAAGWHYYDPDCPIALGSKSMKFVAMQPKKNIDRVCDALGDIGQTVIALDAGDAELREMLWDIRVLRDTGLPDGEENVEAQTVFKLPVEKHRNGMLNFDYSFADADKYMLLVRLKSEDGSKEYVGRHRFTVGLLDNTDLYAYAGFGVFLAAVGGGFAYVRQKRKRAASA